MGIYKVVQIKLPKFKRRRFSYPRRKKRNISVKKAAILFFICLLFMKVICNMHPDKQSGPMPDETPPSVQELVVPEPTHQSKAGKGIFLKEILPFY